MRGLLVVPTDKALHVFTQHFRKQMLPHYNSGRACYRDARKEAHRLLKAVRYYEVHNLADVRLDEEIPDVF